MAQTFMQVSSYKNTFKVSWQNYNWKVEKIYFHNTNMIRCVMYGQSQHY